ncbi:Retinoic acid receptor responder protein 3 [Merluccius polli]|uniref:Retinoic acid receptor responder protein 3 n=1 Tax=Merluccius polli TaxID=89951 RepID=A0AA47MGD1_MERPO|nr:Retinoic acid receptor responder protein 3 [Merluccius polli]
MDLQSQIEDIVSTAQFGDLIEFSYPIGYSHWGVYDGDGCVVHFAVADQGALMTKVSGYLQTAFPVMGDLLLGDTKIRRVPLDKVTVPKGAHLMVSNTRHAGKPSVTNFSRSTAEHFATFVRYGRAVCNQINGQQKNKECEEATERFQEMVDEDSISQELFK